MVKIAKINKKLFLLICLFLICVSVSFAYLITEGSINNDESISFGSELEGYVTLVDTAPLTLVGDQSAPITDSKALSTNLYKNEFKIKNTTKESKTINLYIIALDDSSMDLSYVKYALYESGTSKPTSGEKLGVPYQINEEVEGLMNVAEYSVKDRYYSLVTVEIPAKTTKTFNLHLWVDVNVGKEGMNRNLSAVLFYKTGTDNSEYQANYLSTNRENRIFDLVYKQGVNISNVEGIYFINLATKYPSSDDTIAYFEGVDGSEIKAWRENNNLYIGSEGTTYLGPSLESAFNNYQNLSVIDMSNANTAFVTNMSYMFIYTGASNPDFSLNLGNEFNTANVTNMNGMFYNTGMVNPNFTLNLGNEFNTINVTDMFVMFQDAGLNSNIFTLNLGEHFNTSKVTNMAGMFAEIGSNSTNFTLDLGSYFNTSNVTSMASMFYRTGQNSANLAINLGNHFHTTKVTNMGSMFGNTALINPNFELNLGNYFDTSNVTDMSYMFYNLGYRSNNFTLNLGNKFNTSKVTNMLGMFQYVAHESTNFTINLGNQFNTSNVTDMYGMFSEIGFKSNKVFLNLGNHFNTIKVKYMDYIFSGVGYNNPNFTFSLGNHFNTSNVKSMKNMFANIGYNSNIFKLDLGNQFNTINVTDMSGMISNVGYTSKTFTLNLGNEFNTSNVTDMNYLFYRTGYNSDVFTLDLGNQFNTANVKYMTKMFYDTGANSTGFTLNLGNHFNTSNVTGMVSMFENTGFNSAVFTLNLGNHFNTSKITAFNRMFWNTGTKSQLFTLNLGNQFNTSNAESMYTMFYRTGYESPSFTLNLGNQFYTHKVKNTSWMFTYTGDKNSWDLDLSTADFSNVTDYGSMFLNRSETKIINIICSPLNCDFINARVNGITGYRVISNTSGFTARTITLNTTDSSISVSRTTAYKNQGITISSTNGIVKSFKLNGTLIEGNSFVMPDYNVTISDITVSETIIVESLHNPYGNDLDLNYYENTFEGATSITVELTYETEGASWDYVQLYSSPTTIYQDKKYGGTPQKTETITIPSNYLKIIFVTDYSNDEYYGFRALVTPNY